MSDGKTQATQDDRLEAMWDAIFGKWGGEDSVVYQGLNGSRRTIMAKLRRALAALDAVDRRST